MIEVKDLVKKYGDQIAVDHLTFQVNKGQIYGFLGANGAGKSTTMNIMTGYLAPNEGEVFINGINMLKEPEKAKQNIGYLPELPPVYMDMTVYEYLMFVAEIKKIKKVERNAQVEDIMKITQIGEKKDRLIKNLSKGYRQRVGMAQALIGFPEVIILDEPMVGLDPKQIIEIRDLIKSLRENHTIILSSHILSEVSAICDHVGIIANGKLVASDSPQGLMNRMKQQNHVKITVFSALEDIKEALVSLDGITTYTIESGEGENIYHVVVEQDNQADMRKEVSLLLSKKQIPVMNMVVETKSLEDIFLELTKDENFTSEEQTDQQQESHEDVVEDDDEKENGIGEVEKDDSDL